MLNVSLSAAALLLLVSCATLERRAIWLTETLKPEWKVERVGLPEQPAD